MIYFKRISNLSTMGPEIPFIIRRVYWIDTRGENRGNHAHRTLKQVIICVQGSFSLVVDNGRSVDRYKLCAWNPEGVYVSNEWINMVDCSEDCVILVVASDFYDESEYIRNKKTWKEWINGTVQEIECPKTLPSD